MTDYKALYEAEVKRREKAETRWNKVAKVSRDSKERIKELEKQIEEVKETYHQRGFDAGREEYEVDTELLEEKDEEIEKLKVENKELEKYKTMIYCVWSDLYWADKAGCEVSFKDVSNSCEYYENEEFVKAEVVEDSEDEE